MHFTPAAWVIRQFGARPLARVIGRSHSSVHRWRTRSTCHVPGAIPSDVMPAILDAAAKQGVDVQPVDLIRGRELPDPPAAPQPPPPPAPVPAPLPARPRGR
jgi:hypothetical protein